METLVLNPTQLASEVRLLPRFINRNIDGKHVAKLKKSITRFGVLRDSITVRAPFIGPYLYTLDGQHLHQACIELNESVRSKVVSVSSEKELIAFISDMNSTSKKWDTIDYINSWSANGNEDYKFILSVLNRYNLSAPILFLEVYNEGVRVSNDNLAAGNFTVKKEYGDKILASYDVLVSNGLSKSASSLKAWLVLYKKYEGNLQSSIINKLGALVKKNVKVYSQSANTIGYQTFLDAHLNECL